MCYELDAEPPVPPIAGGAVDSEDLTLTAGDGTQFAAFIARSEGSDGTGPAMVVLPDVRGLFHFYEELALRFAEQGIDSIAFDYFGRTAGVGKRDAEFPFRDHVAQTTFESVKADTAAAVEALRDAGSSDRKIFTVGFCFGGSNSWHQAANGLGIAGAVGFYGHPAREFPTGATPLMERIGEIEAPILGLMGGADEGITPDIARAFDDALEAGGVEHEIVIYDGAPHSFFDRTADEHVEACDDAWRRILEFVSSHSKT